MISNKKKIQSTLKRFSLKIWYIWYSSWTLTLMPSTGMWCPYLTSKSISHIFSYNGFSALISAHWCIGLGVYGVYWYFNPWESYIVNSLMVLFTVLISTCDPISVARFLVLVCIYLFYASPVVLRLFPHQLMQWHQLHPSFCWNGYFSMNMSTDNGRLLSLWEWFQVVYMQQSHSWNSKSLPDFLRYVCTGS